MAKRQNINLSAFIDDAKKNVVPSRLKNEEPTTTDRVEQHTDSLREPGQRGRTKRTLIPRTNGKTVYLEDRHIRDLDEIYWTDRLDRQEVIRTALDEFLKTYVKDGHLNADGVALVTAYHNKVNRA